jgi:predicted lipoprotein with Yx(FWY)xxD motif
MVRVPRRHGLVGLLVALSALTALAGCGSTASSAGSAGTNPAAGSAATTVTTAMTGSTAAPGPTEASLPAGAATVSSTSGPLGTILVDGSGHTLYAFMPDGPGQPTCVSTCAQAWPPLTGTTVAVAQGVPLHPGEFKLVARPDSTMQLAVNGRPLYRFAGDTLPGQTGGQDYDGKWFVVGVDGTVITAKT